MNSFRVEAPKGYDENCTSDLSKVFFSNENMDLLQKKLVVEVFKQTGVKIPFQAPERMLIAMRYVYATYSKELPCRLKEQVRELDYRVMEWILPDVLSSVDLQMAYLRDIEGNIPLLEPPLNVSRRSSVISKTETPSDRQLPSMIRCCPYETNNAYPEKRPATLG